MKGFFPSSIVQKEKPEAGLVAKCGACRLYQSCHSPKIPPFGRGKKQVLVVGEAPGKQEDEEGRPFVGKAGQHLRDVLGEINVRLDRDAWTTNSLICRPPKNATPDRKQISYCRPNVQKAIREFDPQVIVLLGRSALSSVMEEHWAGDMGPLERWIGWQIPMDRHWICPTYHPSYLLRMNNSLMDRAFQNHLEAAFSIQERPPERKDFESKVEIVYDDEEVYRRLRGIDSKGGWIAVDYETNCLKPEYPKGKIYSCAVTNGEMTISYPWIGKSIEATSKLLRSSRTKKIAANLKFEERWTLKKLGHGVSNWAWDTMLAAHCLDNRPGICSLKFQSLVRLGVASYNAHIDPYLKSSGGYYNRIYAIDLKDLLLYGGMDVILEYELAMIQRKEMGYL